MAALPEEIDLMLGQPRYKREAQSPVSRVNIRAMCAAVQDPNPVYQDRQTALDLLGAEYAPASMLSTWARPELWSPGSGEETKPLQLHYDLKELFGFPTAVVSDFESVFHSPLQAGDRVRSQQVLQSVSDEKDTRLGRGRFWIIEVQYHNQRDELLGVESFRCLGYRKVEE